VDAVQVLQRPIRQDEFHLVRLRALRAKCFRTAEMV
jgi:hypothetical protein